MPTIVISNAVGTNTQDQGYNMANGYNVWTLQDTSLEMPKMLLIVKAYDPDNPSTEYEIGKLVRNPNAEGFAHFDIQAILRGNVTFDDDIEQTAVVKTSGDEMLSYRLYAGYIDTDGSEVVQAISPFPPLNLEYYHVLNGRKPFSDLKWDWTDYAYNVNSYEVEIGEYEYYCDYNAKPLTDWANIKEFDPTTDYEPCGLDWLRRNDEFTPVGFIPPSTIVPPTYADAPLLYTKDVNRGEDITFSWVSVANILETPSFANTFQKMNIRRWYIEFANADGSVAEYFILGNTLTNGGGPTSNETSAITTTLKDPYNFVTLQAGASNPDLADAWANTAYTQVHIMPIMDGFYQPYVLQAIVPPPPACIESWADPIGYNKLCGAIIKLNITEPECNDFDHVQVRWKNSFGFADYFTFTKRHDKQIGVERTNYRKVQGSWSENSFTIDPNGRGMTNAANHLTYTGTLRTKYLSDQEANYLQNLIISNDVKVKIDGVWEPVIITNSTWTERTYRKDGLFQLELQYELASPDTNLIQ